jgi:MYXO-CTERM domain-containing protein
MFAVFAACAEPVDDLDHVKSEEQATTVCGLGPTVKGIDVSFYQGNINWTQVKASGVHYAQIRVSDGLGVHDPKFDTYWHDSRVAGVKHGAYQFFEPGQDPIAQADYLLSKIGNEIKSDDMPPMLDVEVTGGLGPAAVAANVKKWVDHVTNKLGRRPIIYTGYYFWRDSVGNANQGASPLWHAQYTTASCPDINKPPWSTWTFWQYTSTGSVGGIAGNVDVDRFNGDLNAFNAFLGPPGTCGDHTCGANEDKISCPEDCGPCGTIDAAGGVIDNGDACYATGGPQTYIRHVTTAGMGNNLDWTMADEDPTEADYVDWTFFFAEAGKYKVEVYTPAPYAESTQADYIVTASGQNQKVVIDQSAVDGWQSLGEFDFAAGGHQGVHLGDNTGELVSLSHKLVFDAVQITPVDDGSGSGSGSGSGDGSGDGSANDPGTGSKSVAGGCSTSGGGGAGLLLAVAAVGVRRRRSR